jgi:hypothetical protein
LLQALSQAQRLETSPKLRGNLLEGGKTKADNFSHYLYFLNLVLDILLFIYGQIKIKTLKIQPATHRQSKPSSKCRLVSADRC